MIKERIKLWDGRVLERIATFITYEGDPIVFVCIDGNGDTYLVDTTEIRGEFQWIISKVDYFIIRDLLYFAISIYDALKYGCEHILAEYDFRTHECTSRSVKFNDIPENRLPDKRAWLEFTDDDAEEEFLKLEAKIIERR